MFDQNLDAYHSAMLNRNYFHVLFIFMLAALAKQTLYCILTSLSVTDELLEVRSADPHHGVVLQPAETLNNSLWI